jgi:mycothiol synthase
MTDIEIERHQDLPARLRDAIEEITAAATAADGVGPLSEDARLAVRHGRPGATHLVGRAVDGTVVGYAFLAPAAADGTSGTELVIAPGSRRRGLGRELARDLVGTTPGAVEAWAHGDHPGARALAAEFGFAAVRELRLLERPVTEADRAPSSRGGTRTPGSR